MTVAHKIFINYRREDNPDAAGRIYDHVVNRFGSGDVFMDVDKGQLPAGADFRRLLSQRLRESAALLAVIGDRWCDISFADGPKRGHRRLDDGEDFVRIEIETALTQRIWVVPVLVGTAVMPKPLQLPDGLLRRLCSLNAEQVRAGPDFPIHIERLLGVIDHARANPQASLAWDLPSNYVTIRFLPPRDDIEDLSMPFNADTTFRVLVDMIWSAATGRLPEYAYGTAWILENPETNTTLQHARQLVDAPAGVFVDDPRTLGELGIRSGTILHVVSLDSVTST